MNKHKSKIAMAIIAMLISSYASAQVSDQQIKDFFASNPTPEQIAAAAANLGMNANQISAAMGVANYGGSQAARDAAINSWVGNQANGYTWNAQGQVVKGAAPSLPDPVGVNQASLEKGVWSPVERRWITNDELRAFGATNPSQEQMMQQAIKLGLNPQAIDYSAYVISGAKDWRDQKYGELVNKLNNSMYTGQYGYGYAEDYSQGAALVKGNGAVHYKMPDGTEVSVRMHNGIPDQSYAEVLAQYNAMKLQSGSGSNASVPIPVPQSYAQQGWPQSNQNSATANANSQHGAPQIDPSVAMAAASSVVGPSKNQICPAGMTVTMTHSGIRKCVGTMIREKPLQITPPKVSSQQPGQTQQPIYIHPPLPPVRVETIQAHEYVGGQNGASASSQGFLESEGTGGLEPNPGYRMPGMFQMPKGYIRAESDWPGATFLEGIGWIAPNGKDLPVAVTGGVMPPPWVQPGTGGLEPNPNANGIRLSADGKYYIDANGVKTPANFGGNDAYPCYDCGSNALPTTGTGGLERNPTYGQMPNGYIKAEPNWPGARLVEGIGWIAPNGKAPAIIDSQSGTGGLLHRPKWNEATVEFGRERSSNGCRWA